MLQAVNLPLLLFMASLTAVTATPPPSWVSFYCRTPPRDGGSNQLAAVLTATGLALAAAVAVLVGAVVVLRLFFVPRRTTSVDGVPVTTIGVFHPYCNSGGGGERVLWVAIKALEALSSPQRRLRVVIFTGDLDASGASILKKAKDTFHVDPSPKLMTVDFVYITNRRLLEASTWPRLTILGQSLGSMAVALQACGKLNPDVFLDTTGYAFTYIVAKLLCSCRVATYTHYPTITTDMINRVYERRPTYNNTAAVARSPLFSRLKVIYYRLFALLYWIAGQFANVVMVNSNWTKAHIDSLWSLRGASSSRVVFPPCNTEELQSLRLGSRERIVLSIGQFRPEKDHKKQIQAFRILRDIAPEVFKDCKLVIVGGARGEDDMERVRELKTLAIEEGVGTNVEFLTNEPFPRLRDLLGRSLIGLHTMWCEHFGISIVEMMAAGVVVVAHRSGGPQKDIVVPFEGKQTGWLADTPQEYAEALQAALSSSNLLGIAVAARKSVARFSDEEFSRGFLRAMEVVVPRASGRT